MWIVAISASSVTRTVDRVFGQMMCRGGLKHGMAAQFVKFGREIFGENFSIVADETVLLFFGVDEQARFGASFVGSVAGLAAGGSDGCRVAGVERRNSSVRGIVLGAGGGSLRSR